MNDLNQRHLKHSFIHQHDGYDCGAACLLSVMRYYHWPVDYAMVSEWLQTGEDGVTMLQLKNAAIHSGFRASAFQMGIGDLQKINLPVILHTVNAQQVNHFVICYGYKTSTNCFIIGDPAIGICELTPGQLQQCWISNAALILEPGKPVIQANKHGKWYWFFTLMHDEKLLLILITILGLLATAMGLGLAIYLQVLTDKLIPANDKAQLAASLILLALLFLARVVVANYRQKVIIMIMNRFNKQLVHEFFKHLAKLPAWFLHRNTTGDLIVRFNDTQNIQLAFGTAVSLILVDLVMLAAVTSCLFLYSTNVAIISLIFISLALYQTIRRSRVLRQRQLQFTADLSHTSNVLIHTINEMKHDKSPVTGMDPESDEFYQFIQSAEQFATGVRQASLRLDMLGAFVFAAIVGYSSLQLLDQTLSKGQFVALITLVSGIFPVTQRICNTGMIMMDGLISLERVYAVIAVAQRNEASEHVHSSDHSK